MVSKRKSSKRRAKAKSSGDKFYREGIINKCNYCRKRITGMPHSCKFCGEKHCNDHLVPENHNCPGLRNPVWGNGEIITIPELPSREPPIKKPLIQPKRKFPFKSLVLIVLIISSMFLVYLYFPKSASSEKAFDYVNQYRISIGSPKLIFSEGLSKLARKMSDQEQSDNRTLSTYTPERAFINKNVRMDNVSMTYVRIYTINGKGTSEFKIAFDNFGAGKDLIRLPNFKWGAVGCNVNYCTLISLATKEVIIQ